MEASDLATVLLRSRFGAGAEVSSEPRDRLSLGLVLARAFVTGPNGSSAADVDLGEAMDGADLESGSDEGFVFNVDLAEDMVVTGLKIKKSSSKGV